MADDTHQEKSLALSQVELQPQAPEPASQNAERAQLGKPDSAVPRPDKYLAAAKREYESGWIDRPLWAQLLAQADNDEAKARDAYLRTRATVLRLAKRDRHAEDAAWQVPPASERHPKPGSRRRDPADPPRRNSRPTLQKVAAAALGLMLLAVVAWQLVPSQDSSDPGSSPDQTSGAANPRTATQKANSRSIPATGGSRATAPTVEDEGFAVRVARLRAAENWNVLVLQASEWTRKEPANPDAWRELSVGYTRMRQFDDAFAAATKAAQVAPDNASVWRNLGEVGVAMGQPVAALQAYERSAALDERDVPTLVRVGWVSAQLVRLPEAKAAFDKALAVSPDDADALCGQAWVARLQGQPREADAMTQRAQSQGRSCRDAADRGPASSTPPASAQYFKPPGTR